MNQAIQVVCSKIHTEIYVIHGCFEKVYRSKEVASIRRHNNQYDDEDIATHMANNGSLKD